MKILLSTSLAALLTLSGHPHAPPPQTTSEITARDAFTHIYETAAWGRNSQGEPCSGHGSFFENVKPYIAFLEDFIQKNEIKTIVDAGCGDWEFSRHVDWKGARYIGFDVVQSVIDKNIKNFEKPEISFVCDSIVESDLPSADLFICKDVMQHLPHRDIKKLCAQFSKFKYCLITNDVDMQTLTSSNKDIMIRGHLTTLDLTKPPFNLEGIKVLTFLVQDDTDAVMKQVLLIKGTK